MASLSFKKTLRIFLFCSASIIPHAQSSTGAIEADPSRLSPTHPVAGVATHEDSALPTTRIKAAPKEIAHEVWSTMGKAAQKAFFGLVKELAEDVEEGLKDALEFLTKKFTVWVDNSTGDGHKEKTVRLGCIPPKEKTLKALFGKGRVTEHKRLAAVQFPTQHILEGIPPCGDQEDLGACTGWALKKALECIEAQDPTKSPEERGAIAAGMIYLLERALEGTLEQDAGASLATGILALTTIGVADESKYPYEPHNFTKLPSEEAFQQAQDNMLLLKAESIDPSHPDNIKAALFEGKPVVFGTLLYENFFTMTDGKVSLPKGPLRGGHALWLCGWDDTIDFGHEMKGGFLFQNHWSEGWGTKAPTGAGGFGWLPYDLSYSLFDVWALGKKVGHGDRLPSYLNTLHLQSFLGELKAQPEESSAQALRADALVIETPVAEVAAAATLVVSVAPTEVGDLAADSAASVVQTDVVPATKAPASKEEEAPTANAVHPAPVQDETQADETKAAEASASIESAVKAEEVPATDTSADPAAASQEAPVAPPSTTAALISTTEVKEGASLAPETTEGGTQAGAPTSTTDAKVEEALTAAEAHAAEPVDETRAQAAASAQEEVGAEPVAAAPAQPALLPPQDSAVVVEEVQNVVSTGTAPTPGSITAPIPAAPSADEGTRHSSVSMATKPKGSWANPTKSFVRRVTREGVTDDVLDLLEAKMARQPTTSVAPPAASFQPASPPPTSAPQGASEEASSLEAPEVVHVSTEAAAIPEATASAPTPLQSSFTDTAKKDAEAVEHALVDGAKAVVHKVEEVVKDVVTALEPAAKALEANIVADATAAVVAGGQAAATAVEDAVTGVIHKAENAAGISSDAAPAPVVASTPTVVAPSTPAGTTPLATHPHTKAALGKPLPRVHGTTKLPRAGDPPATTTTKLPRAGDPPSASGSSLGTTGGSHSSVSKSGSKKLPHPGDPK